MTSALLHAALAQMTPATSWMPVQNSTFASNVDNLFYFILYLCIFFFVLIIGAMTQFALKYKRENNTKTSPVKGNHKLELAWSVLPSILLLAMFLWGFKAWMVMNVPPPDALDVRVTGQKWSWSFDYPKQGVISGELVVPAGRPVRLTMSSVDVIHSFYVPAFRIKRDVIPNRYTVLWFQALEPAEHPVFCTEYCGRSHSQMLTKAIVKSEADFKAWVEQQAGGNLSPTQLGADLFKSQGCTACHSVDGSPMLGPTLFGIAGHDVELLDGTKVMADDNYIRESIVNPAAKVVKGFAPVMPPYAGRFNDKQMNALVDYIKSLQKK